MTTARAVDGAMGVGRIVVAVGAVIEEAGGSVLLVKHRPERKGFWQGRWICPGGKLELGESIRDGVLREVWEETRLDVELTRPLPPFERIVRSEDGTSLHVIYIDYKARVTGGVLRPGGDVGEARWAAIGELPLLLPELHEDTTKLLRLAGVLPARAVRI